jgi:hypothetical protein
VCLKHWFKDDLRCRHGYPVAHRGETEWSEFAGLTGFGNVDSSESGRTVGSGLQVFGEFLEKGCHPGRLDVFDGHPIHAGRPLVCTNIVPGPRQDVASGDFVVEGMETT